MEAKSVEEVPIVCKYPVVFPEELEAKSVEEVPIVCKYPDVFPE
jgi:hypothetical protein